MVKITIDRALDGSLKCKTKIRKADALEASHQLMAAVLEIRIALLNITPREIVDDMLALFVTAMAEGDQSNPSHDEEAKEDAEE